METLQYSGQLTIVTCWCGMRQGVPSELWDEDIARRDRMESPKGIYCPLGHTFVPIGETEADKLRRSLQIERQAHDQTRARLRTVGNKLNAERSAKSRLTNRVAHGVCPCCQRTFKQLAAHIKRKHPEYVGARKVKR